MLPIKTQAILDFEEEHVYLNAPPTIMTTSPAAVLPPFQFGDVVDTEELFMPNKKRKTDSDYDEASISMAVTATLATAATVIPITSNEWDFSLDFLNDNNDGNNNNNGNDSNNNNNDGDQFIFLNDIIIEGNISKTDTPPDIFLFNTNEELYSTIGEFSEIPKTYLSKENKIIIDQPLSSELFRRIYSFLQGLEYVSIHFKSNENHLYTLEIIPTDKAMALMEQINILNFSNQQIGGAFVGLILLERVIRFFYREDNNLQINKNTLEFSYYPNDPRCHHLVNKLSTHVYGKFINNKIILSIGQNFFYNQQGDFIFNQHIFNIFNGAPPKHVQNTMRPVTTPILPRVTTTSSREVIYIEDDDEPISGASLPTRAAPIPTRTPSVVQTTVGTLHQTTTTTTATTAATSRGGRQHSLTRTRK